MRGLTHEDARKRLEKSGITIAAWARNNNIPPRAVYDVLLGRCKGRYGNGHKAAVLLGIKDGNIQP